VGEGEVGEGEGRWTDRYTGTVMERKTHRRRPTLGLCLSLSLSRTRSLTFTLTFSPPHSLWIIHTRNRTCKQHPLFDPPLPPFHSLAPSVSLPLRLQVMDTISMARALEAPLLNSSLFSSQPAEEGTQGSRSAAGGGEGGEGVGHAAGGGGQQGGAAGAKKEHVRRHSKLAVSS
jgi:hypothetical protein